MLTRLFPTLTFTFLPDNVQNRTTKLGQQGCFGRCPKSSFSFLFTHSRTSNPFFVLPERRACVAHICYCQAWFVFSFHRSTWCLHGPVTRSVTCSIYCFAAASEVSSILESRISGTSVGGNVEETGRVLSMSFVCPWRIRLSKLFLQASVTVSGVFGVSRTCKVCSFSFDLNLRNNYCMQPRRWWNSLLVFAACV